MKEFAKLFGVMVLAVALTGLVACGGDNNEGEDTVVNEDTNGTDTNTGIDTNTTDEGRDTNGTDTNGTDANTGDTKTDEVCTPVCEANTCADDGCGTPCACDDGYECTQVEGVATCTVIACTPACEGKVCGDSGCKDEEGNVITCGTCTEGTACNELDGQCYATCDYPADLPQTWGETGVVSYLHIPANATEKTPCFDYTNDGTGDCGLTGLAPQANGPLADMIADASIAIMFEFAGVDDFTNKEDFTLKGLMGASASDPAVLAGDMYVDQASYVEGLCIPMIQFDHSSITAGALAAGPGNFTISVPLSTELVLTVHLIDAQIKANLTAGTTGVSATDGILSGVVTKEELVSILDKLDAECEKDPPPASVEDICSYLGVARTAMAMLFDMHQVGDGTYIVKDAENPGDAASLCLQFNLAESNIIGYTPAAE